MGFFFLFRFVPGVRKKKKKECIMRVCGFCFVYLELDSFFYFSIYDSLLLVVTIPAYLTLPYIFPLLPLPVLSPLLLSP